MSEDLRVEIDDFTDRVAAKVSESTVADVKDWASLTEWLLALDVLAEHLFDSGNKVESAEWRDFQALAIACGADPRRYAYVDPAAQSES